MFTHKMTGYEDHTHETVAEARDCEAETREAEADALAEYLMEQRAERFFEERGGDFYAASEEEARDRWLDSLLDR